MAASTAREAARNRTRAAGRAGPNATGRECKPITSGAWAERSGALDSHEEEANWGQVYRGKGNCYSWQAQGALPRIAAGRGGEQYGTAGRSEGARRHAVDGGSIYVWEAGKSHRIASSDNREQCPRHQGLACGNASGSGQPGACGWGKEWGDKSGGFVRSRHLQCRTSINHRTGGVRCTAHAAGVQAALPQALWRGVSGQPGPGRDFAPLSRPRLGAPGVVSGRCATHAAEAADGCLPRCKPGERADPAGRRLR